MTLYDTIITHDPRIKLTGDFATTFNLHISNIQKEDRGVYMCQINTDPMIYQRAQLDVNIPPDIDGARTSGNKIMLSIFKGKSCILRNFVSIRIRTKKAAKLAKKFSDSIACMVPVHNPIVFQKSKLRPMNQEQFPLVLTRKSVS